ACRGRSTATPRSPGACATWATASTPPRRAVRRCTWARRARSTPRCTPRSEPGEHGMLHAKRWLFLIHRWLGVLLCAFFAMSFISGVVMMYVGYPKLTPAERLEHLPPLRTA